VTKSNFKTQCGRSLRLLTDLISVCQVVVHKSEERFVLLQFPWQRQDPIHAYPVCCF